MNKLGIWAIVIAGAFLIGIFSANPVVEAVGSVGGWQPIVEDLQDQIDAIPQIITRTSIFPLEPSDVGTTLQFFCEPGEIILGGSLETSGPLSVRLGSADHRDQLYLVIIANQNPDPVEITVTWSCLVVSNGV